MTEDERSTLVAEIQKRIDEASTGPWVAKPAPDGRGGLVLDEENDGIVAITESFYNGAGALADAKFMAHARADLPALLDLLEADGKQIALEQQRTKKVLDLWEETISKGRQFLAGPDLVLKMRVILQGVQSNHEETDLAVLAVEEELAVVEAKLELAEKTISDLPHGTRKGGLQCTSERRARHNGCTCWKADYEAQKEALS